MLNLIHKIQKHMTSDARLTYEIALNCDRIELNPLQRCRALKPVLRRKLYVNNVDNTYSGFAQNAKN